MSDEPDLLRELLSAPDRDQLPNAAPLVSVHEDDEESFMNAVESRATARIELTRRGVWHGRLAELARDDAPRREDLGERWRACRPIVLERALKGALNGIADSVRLALGRIERLHEPDELRAWLARRLERGAPSDVRFELGPATPTDELADPERDLARVELAATGADGRRHDGLWVKVGRLSTHPHDRSRRIRFSFGAEGVDDANPDPARNALVARLAELALPEAVCLRDNARLTTALENLAPHPLRLTQHIAYFNAPGGGALFHHDSFEVSSLTPERRQHGVVYVQLAGNTLWLALSIRDLARRVREFTEHLADGQLPWVRAELFPGETDFVSTLELVEDEDALLVELARPGCGALGPLVNRGPEFTGLLADCGHACLLRPGDLILLPNRDPRTTAMHSVFCASSEPTYGLSCALREVPAAPGERRLVARENVHMKRRRRGRPRR